VILGEDTPQEAQPSADGWELDAEVECSQNGVMVAGRCEQTATLNGFAVGTWGMAEASDAEGLRETLLH
jgi:hypothetical protein